MGRLFNGSSDKILATTVAAASSWTISCWAQANTTSGTQTIVYDGNDASNGFGIQSADGSAHVRGVVGTAGNVTSTQAPSTTAFAHYALVNNAGSQTLYYNGASIGTASLTPVAPSSGNLSIGVGTTTNFFNGQVADVAVWTSALNLTQIGQLAVGYRPVDVAAPAGWWPLSGYSSPEPDISGNANNGTLTGTSQAPMPPSLGRGGRNLNSGTNLMQNTSIVVPAVNGQSMATWVNVGSFNVLQNVVRCTPGDGVQGFYIAGGSNIISFGGTLLILNTGSLATNTWYHLAVTLNAAANNTIFYLNGSSTASGNATDHLLLAGTKTLGAGYVGSANPLTGYVADQAFWTTELTSTDVANLYAGRRPNSIQSASLLSWWPCDGFSNATEPDRSGHGYDYTITGGVTPLLGPPQLWRLG
jgi:hypothetical protein